MPRPTDVMDIVTPKNPDFRGEGGWEIEFGDWQWFYIAGVRELMHSAKIYDKSLVYSLASKAEGAVPKAWMDVQRDGEWDKFSQSQMRRAIDGEKMRFDKACLSIICLELAVAASGSNLDIYKSVEIRPAMFKVGGFERPFFEGRVLGTKYADSLVASCLQREDVFKEMAHGHAATYPTAHSVNATLRDHFERVGNVYLITTKKQSLGKPSPSEYPMFTRQPAH